MPTPPVATSARQILWSFRREIVWVAIFSFFVNLLMISPTLYMLQIFDRVMISRSDLTLIALTLVILLFFAVMALADWLRSRILVRAGVRFDEVLNRTVFAAGFESSLAQSRHNAVAAFNDLTNLRQFLTGNGVFAFFDTPWSMIYIGVLFLMHPVLGWISIGFLVFLLIIAVIANMVSTPRYKRAMESSTQANQYLGSKLRNAEVVHAMGMLGNLRHRWLGLYGNQLVRQTEALRLAQGLQAFTKFVQYSQQSIILAAGAWLAIRGEISVGAMVASNALMANALRPISLLVTAWKQYVDARQAYRRLSAMIDEHPERLAGRDVPPPRAQITLRELVATAVGRKAPILRGLNAEFPAGNIIAIIGPSGAGKSTLARCMVGIWPKSEGQVLLDGHPIREWNREELGPHIGYLPQDIEMFDGTLAENIARFGEIEPEKVIEAAERTGIHEMILRLPRGYDTPMGVAGGLLSGGQRQSVGLARAIYGSPRLVVLDEPNSNLDDNGVMALARTLQDLKAHGTSVFMIVQQRSLLAVADHQMILEAGEIKHFGPITVTRTATA